MTTQQGTIETNSEQPVESARTIWTSAAVSAACFTLYFAEKRGFRIFEQSVQSFQTLEEAVPSPIEILTVLGVTSLGVCAGLVALISSVMWIVRHVRQTHGATQGGFAGGAVQQSAS
jgi:hypothetical protein